MQYDIANNEISNFELINLTINYEHENNNYVTFEYATYL